jgi:GGDEF domain-containing protein
MAEEAQKSYADGTAIQEEQLQLLFSQAPLAIILSPVAAVVLSLAIWEVVDRRLAIIWIVVVFVALLRGGMFVLYTTRPGTIAMNIWEHLFTASLLAAGLAWGVGGWLLLPEELAYRTIVFFFQMGMASAAVSVYAIHGPRIMLTVVVLVLPTAVDFLLQDSLPQQLMGAVVVLYLVSANRSLRVTNPFVQRFHSLSYDLRRAKEQAEMLARTDFLTGMNNRPSFYDLCKTPFKIARKHGQDLAVILFDIDRFKEVNDSYGHAIGDDVLRNLSQIVSATCRESDVAGRVGGEEFAILLPHTNANSAHELAERLREQMAPACESLDALVATADAAMYTAKQRGRNCVYVMAPAGPEPEPRDAAC